MNNNPNRGKRPPATRQPNPGKGPRRPANQAPRTLTPEEKARRAAQAKRRREAEEARQRAIREEERRRAREKARKKNERNQNMKIFGGRFLVFLAIFIILCVITVLLFSLDFNHTPDAPDDSGKIAYYYGGEKIRTVPAADAVSGKSVYFCMGDLADYLGMAESGDAENMKFIFTDPAHPAEDSSGSGYEEIAIFHSDMNRVTLGGQTVILDIPNILRGDEIWVSGDFITEYMTGLFFSYNEDKSEVRIAKIKDEENSTDEVTVYLPVSFKLKSADAIPPVDNPDGSEHATVPQETNPPLDEPEYELNFKNDLSDYEQYMDPEDRDGYLILVNTKNKLTENDIPSDLIYCVDTESWEQNTKQMRLYAAKSLEALFIEMRSAGYNSVKIRSAYRDYNYQDQLFNYYVNRELTDNPSLSLEAAEQIVLTFSTRPGTSEHQTGLAVDMDNSGRLVTDFQYDPEYKLLSENAWKFGFILRFPADKTEITTIQFEPWHYRFVGRYHAKKIYDSGLCLEEYIAQLVS